MHKPTCLLALMLCCSVAALAQTDKAARAQELLTQARTAIGGDKLKSLQSLAISGSYRQMMGEREMSGDIELEMLLPDKARKTTTMSPLPSVEITRIEGLNGDNAWSDMQNNNAGGGMVVIRQAGAGQANSAEAQKAQENFVRQEFARLWLGLLLNVPGSYQLEFSYGGEAEAPDGVADVLEIKGAGGFSAMLFLDQKTHRPLMLSYKGRKPRLAMRSFTSDKPLSKEELEKKTQEAQAQAAAAPLVDVQLRFQDYQEVGGIAFPHRVTKAMDNEITEEWELKKFKLNPALKADRFEKK